MTDAHDGYPYRVITSLCAGDIGPARRCQYPLGGGGAATGVCGRRSRPGSSYCWQHHRACTVASPQATDVPVTHVTTEHGKRR